MPKNNYRVTRHGDEIETFTTNSGVEVLEFLQDFLYDGDNAVGHKIIVERVATLSQHDVRVSGAQGVQIGDRNSMSNTFTSTQQTAVTHVQNVRAENGNAYVSAGSMTVHQRQDGDLGDWPPPGWPFNV